MGTYLVDEIVSAADEIMETVDSDDAIEFAESVKNKALGIGDTMESMAERGISPTERQIEALENMMKGCSRWLGHP